MAYVLQPIHPLTLPPTPYKRTILQPIHRLTLHPKLPLQEVAKDLSALPRWRIRSRNSQRLGESHLPNSAPRSLAPFAFLCCCFFVVGRVFLLLFVSCCKLSSRVSASKVVLLFCLVVFACCNASTCRFPASGCGSLGLALVFGYCWLAERLWICSTLDLLGRSVSRVPGGSSPRRSSIHKPYG